MSRSSVGTPNSPAPAKMILGSGFDDEPAVNINNLASLTQPASKAPLASPQSNWHSYPHSPQRVSYERARVYAIHPARSIAQATAREARARLATTVDRSPPPLSPAFPSSREQASPFWPR